MKNVMTLVVGSLLTACGGYESQKEDVEEAAETTTDTDFDINEEVQIDENDRFADFVYVTQEAVGDSSCFEAGYEANGGWNEQAKMLAEAEGAEFDQFVNWGRFVPSFFKSFVLIFQYVNYELFFILIHNIFIL